MIHKFGGQWTEEKLDKLRKYLSAYTKIFTKNRRAAFFTTTYLDAFAGTGFREGTQTNNDESLNLFEGDDQDATSLKQGSVSIALELNPGFDRYIFVDNNPKHTKLLSDLIDAQYPTKKAKISVCLSEANQHIQKWCREIDWSKNRAVVFLDPYGMQVEWQTLEVIAKTQAIDLWILFPLGQGINRMLTRSGSPDKSWNERLTKFFGTSDWLSAFYSCPNQGSLFDGGQELRKDADFDSIKLFLVNRLEGIFAGVSQRSLALRNSKNIPIFLLCFATGNPNPRAKELAIKIANDILEP